jgi:hypothetical protein
MNDEPTHKNCLPRSNGGCKENIPTHANSGVVQKMEIGNLLPVIDKERILALGVEGSANKIGVGMNIRIFFSCNGEDLDRRGVV